MVSTFSRIGRKGPRGGTHRHRHRIDHQEWRIISPKRTPLNGKTQCFQIKSSGHELLRFLVLVILLHLREARGDTSAVKLPAEVAERRAGRQTPGAGGDRPDRIGSDRAVPPGAGVYLSRDLWRWRRQNGKLLLVVKRISLDWTLCWIVIGGGV